MITGESARIKHLLRRAAFGYRSSDWARYASLGEAGVLKTLVDYDSIPMKITDLPLDDMGGLVAPNDVDSLKRYWLFRFCQSSRPLEEVMTMFWHHHFATSDYKVQNPSIEYRQNQLLRKHAMGSFRDLLGVIAIDPAMLIWLDGNNSTKKAPNENFSRELLELFTMGIDGGYTEHDVKEGAKSFTGWSYDSDRFQVKFNDKNFNDTPKEYLGQKGDFNLGTTLDIVARHPSTPRFVTKKLFEFFVHDNPPPEEIDRLCKVYYDTRYSIRELVRAILTSPHFYSDEALYSQIKWPVQYTVMLVKTLDVPYTWIQDMQSYADNMGQQLYNPPNVKGWKTGRNWINTNTMTARLNFAKHAVDQLRYRQLVKQRVTDGLAMAHLKADASFRTAETAIEDVWEWLLPSMPLTPDTRQMLKDYMHTGAPKKPTESYYWDRAHGLVELILTCPEYQLA
ncbi:MAG: DUF1800 domain-containing protein [Fimbriimonas sp.]|nr:DUF1800 domain-containing protein [Fimbriimonas sp.]